MYLSVDICVILEDKFPNKVGDYIPLDSGSAKMVQSCFTPGGNASFIPDDLVANFDFSGSVTFNSAKLKGDIDELFQNLPKCINLNSKVAPGPDFDRLLCVFLMA